MKQIIYYKDKNGSEPYNDWVQHLSLDYQTKIESYLKRICLGGSKKNIRALGSGLFEVKIPLGPGIRIYFGQNSLFLLVLLLGGDKKSQKLDILKARKYWSSYEKIQNF